MSLLWPGPFGTFESDGLEHPFLNTAVAAVLFFFFLDVFQLLGQI